MSEVDDVQGAVQDSCGREDFHPYKDILAVPIEPLNQLVITAGGLDYGQAAPSSDEDLRQNQYWHFVV